MQIVDIAGDPHIVSSKYHVTGKPLESFGPEFKIGATPDINHPARW